MSIRCAFLGHQWDLPLDSDWGGERSQCVRCGEWYGGGI